MLTLPAASECNDANQNTKIKITDTERMTDDYEHSCSHHAHSSLRCAPLVSRALTCERVQDMENDESPYEVLGVSTSACASELRHAYQHLARQLHPDRKSTSHSDDGAGGDGDGATGSDDAFVRVQRAYDLLRDPEARRRFDATERAARLESAGSAARVLEVDLDEMSYEEEEVEVQMEAPLQEADAQQQQPSPPPKGSVGISGVWRYDCRCGDVFELREAQLLQGIEALHCKSCSYVLRPLYRLDDG